MTTTRFTLPGLTLTDLRLDAPLDHGRPGGETIEIFARVATRPGGEHLPYLVFLQGGPGNPAPRPSLQPMDPPWLGRALEDYQVVMLDQRGTGGSTPLGTSVDRAPGEAPDATLTGGLAGKRSAAEQAEYLTHFRADAIVADCELVREALGAERWTLLGQSFGGFTTVHYLSVHPASLAGAIVTGGLTAVQHPVDDVYAATWQTQIAKSERFYRAFPGDRERMRRLAGLAGEGRLTLPNGDRVSPDRLRTLGHLLGGEGGVESLHYLLDLDPFSPAFAHHLAGALPFGGRSPIYAVLHESSYADGIATRWSAERTMPAAVRDDATLLGGEHIHRSLFTEDTELAPLAGAADLLAEHEWNQLYFPAALATADVPVAASVYYDDAYVPLEYSMETAALLPDCRPWVTSQYEHNGLRTSGGDVLDRLIALLQGRARI